MTELSTDHTAPPQPEPAAPAAAVGTLAVDIGGSGIKTIVLDEAGQAVTDRLRLETPQPAEPTGVVDAIATLAAEQGSYQRVSVGFPGIVRQGIIGSAVNLGSGWVGLNLAQVLADRLGQPVRVANDADIQGLGVMTQLQQPAGVDLVITLGTGMGSALFIDGQLVPNLELAHHPFRKGDTYEQQLGRVALQEAGTKRWNKRLQKAMDRWQALFNYDRLHLGGGEAKRVRLELPSNVTVVPNILGLLGGIALWQRPD